MSNNETYLLTLSGNELRLAYVDNAFPRGVMVFALAKVWYESYPEPEYVWQTSSADDEFEAKYSLVPIAFGTLKAAAFAMMFAVPIAVLGAIYTAYFMTPTMRRVVKPSIELMEALPTVIIGFIAGLWFAPMVESHLSAVIALILILPISIIMVGGLWNRLPNVWTSRLPNGLHVVILMPLMVLLTVLIWSQSTNIEWLLFDGDVRVYLAEGLVLISAMLWWSVLLWGLRLYQRFLRLQRTLFSLFPSICLMALWHWGDLLANLNSCRLIDGESRYFCGYDGIR